MQLGEVQPAKLIDLQRANHYKLFFGFERRVTSPGYYWLSAKCIKMGVPLYQCNTGSQQCSFFVMLVHVTVRVCVPARVCARARACVCGSDIHA